MRSFEVRAIIKPIFRGLRDLPLRGKPICGDQKQHRLAAARRLVKRAHPALAGGDAALWIKIEEDSHPPGSSPPGTSNLGAQWQWLISRRDKARASAWQISKA
jgi:hypothetical protein